VRCFDRHAETSVRRGRRCYFIDEVHRFSKTQQDVLAARSGKPAGHADRRRLRRIPAFSVISPLLSRSLLLTLKPLSDDDISTLLDRALGEDRGLADAYRLDLTLEP
jgi:putative ATPase